METIATRERLADVLAAHDRIYVRISNGPDADRAMGASRNHATGRREAGLSVNAVNETRHLTEYCFSLLGQPDAYAWLLTGAEVGRGGDNEPVLADWSPVARRCRQRRPRHPPICPPPVTTRRPWWSQREPWC